MQEFEGTLTDFKTLLEKEPGVLGYFSTDECQVCHALKPQIAKMIAEEFPELKIVYVPLNRQPEISGQFQLFAVPTVILFLEGREVIRKSRSFSVYELKNEISRPYQLLFS